MEGGSASGGGVRGGCEVEDAGVGVGGMVSLCGVGQIGVDLVG